MSAVARSGGSSSSSSIPANARRVVQDLMEIVKNSEDEIYAMLKECNMDPNETVQRLLSQGTFHEVKRRRDKKKENMNKEFGETRARPSSVGPVRGGRISGRGAGRGNYIPRHSFDASSGGRGQTWNGSDNGSHQILKAPNTITTSTASVEPQGQIKTGFTGASDRNPVAPMAISGPAGLPNGRPQYINSSQGPRGSWGTGPGQAKIADIVKSSNAENYMTTAPSSSKAAVPLLSSSNVTDGVFSLSPDHTLYSYANDSPVTGAVNIKQDIAERSIGKQIHLPALEADPLPNFSKQSPQLHLANTYQLDDIEAVDADMPSSSVSSSLSPESSMNHASILEVIGSSEGPAIPSSGSITSLVANQYNGRVVYPTEQQTFGSLKGSGLEWRPKSPVKSNTAYTTVSLDTARPPPTVSPEDRPGLLLSSISKLKQLNIVDEQPVIIPDHLQVPEADRTHLSFGSFGNDFDTSYSTQFANEEDKQSSASLADDLPEREPPSEEPIASSLVSLAAVSLKQECSNQSATSSVEALVGINDVSTRMPTSAIPPPIPPQEVPKSGFVVQQSTQNPYLSAIQNYTGFAGMPQLIGGQYTYEPSESQRQEVSRLSNVVSPYSDPAANYYSLIFRPSSDIDARYSHFVSTNAANKYNTGGVNLMTGQGLSSSQEGGNSMVIPAAGASGQTAQVAGIAQTGLAIPQQPLPMHAYPAQHAGVPLTPYGGNVFGIQYVPPGYGYVPPPFQHSYAGNTGFPLAPGSTYAPAASAYPPAGAPAVKFSLPQYKPAVAAGNTPHAAVAAGYGSFTSPAGFTTVNPVVTTATASGFDEFSGPQYKDNNLYFPSQQQAEGSTVWIQPPLSRDTTGLQTNSYYNILGQGQQHTGFGHTQSMHAVPTAAYASLYHQSQSSNAPTVHHLLQQPQALGAVGGVGTQTGTYQQLQRGQLSWTNNYQ